ncbi:MAG: glycerophosphodiester phosphodiesterase [Bacteriovoracaceae bacterium]|nr:glycerophosphodiester phosphodiesterase [Bacteriovoracaceae bacterium]
MKRVSLMMRSISDKILMIFRVFFTLLFLTSCASQQGSKRSIASIKECQDDGTGCPFLVVGHRGAPYVEAENTIPAYEAALKLGANALEIDLVMTKDDEVAVFHDRTPGNLIALARQIGAEGQKYIPYNPGLLSSKRLPTEELTLSELREFYGYALSMGVVGDTLLSNTKDESAVIPTIFEFSNWANQQNELYAVFLDIKLIPGQEELAKRMATHFSNAFKDSPYRVYMMTPYDEIYETLQQWILDNPKAANHFLTLDMENEGVLGRVKVLKKKLKQKVKSIGMGSTPFRGWDTYGEEVKKVLEERNSSKNSAMYPIVSWTVDDEKKLYQLLQSGVDGVLTNRPDRLHRLLNRHWKDHSTLSKTLSACYQEDVLTYCASGSDINPLGSINYQQIRNWVCSEEEINGELKDLYGCGGLFDKKNIFFKDEIDNSKEVIIYTNAQREVKVSRSIGRNNEIPTLLTFDQEKCFDGVANNSCEYQLQVDVYENSAWRELKGLRIFKDSFEQVVFVNKNVKKIRVRLREMDESEISDEAILYLDNRSGTQKRFLSPNKVFQGKIEIQYLEDKSETVSKNNIALEFEEQFCNDGILNNVCEYFLKVESLDKDNKTIETQFSKGNLSNSFQVFTTFSSSIKNIKVTLYEMDGSKISTSAMLYLPMEHGAREEISDELEVFSGKISVKFLDYDPSTQHSEGIKGFKPHQQLERNNSTPLYHLP